MRKRRAYISALACKATRTFIGSVVLLAAAHAHAATVVTDYVISQTTQKQSNVPVTFGQVFKKGDVPRGSTVGASVNGRQATLQVDPKSTNADGSLRHAVLTLMVPLLPGNAKLPLRLSTQSAPAATTEADRVSLPQLLASSYDAKISVKIDNKSYTADARALLQAANTAHACKPWNRQCNLWLSGPLTSEWVVNGPVTAADGAINPSLSIYFAVRAYAGATPNTLGYVRTDVIVENSSAFSPQAQPQYTAAVTSGTAAYTSPALTQYAYTRWHYVLWWNDAQPPVYLRQDTQYIQASKAVSRYMALIPDEKFLAGLRQSCPPLDRCDQTKDMGDTGAQAAIGPLPRWTSVYIVDPDVRAYHWMLANTDALGAYSIHYRDQENGWPVSLEKHPNVTTANWADAAGSAKQRGVKGARYKADLLPGCTNNAVVVHCTSIWYGTGNPNAWDNAHQPSESYVPYMVTGDYYYMSELAFGASNNNLWSNETYRNFSQGLIDRSHTQVRAKAWVLREMADAAYLLPDHYPLKNEFNTQVENSLKDWNARYTHNPHANSLGIMNDGAIYNLSGGQRNGMAPWQHNFLTWSAGHAAELGFNGAAEFRGWLAKFEIGLMTDSLDDPTEGYCWLQASTYNLRVRDASGHWLPTYSAVYAATFPRLTGLACNSPAMLEAAGTSAGKPRRAGEMPGYPESPTGFTANFQVGVAAATDSGLPKAQAAWDVFQSRSVKPPTQHGYNNYPNFAILPRSAQ